MHLSRNTGPSKGTTPSDFQRLLVKALGLFRNVPRCVFLPYRKNVSLSLVAPEVEVVYCNSLTKKHSNVFFWKQLKKQRHPALFLDSN